MARANSQAVYRDIADLQLWMKIRAGDQLVMSDVSELLSLRWPQIRDKWGFLKKQIDPLVVDSADPDFLKEKLDDFTDFIDSQRNVTSVNPFDDSSVFFSFLPVLEVFSISLIPISNDEQKIIDDTVNRIDQFSKSDFVKIKNTMRDARDEEADVSSAGDEDYNRAFNRSSVAAQTDLSITDTQLMKTLQDGIRSIDFILANIQDLDTVTVDPFALAKQNANNPEIDIRSFSTGTLMKLQYGEDLQQMAHRMYGDSERWIEIAIANGLKPPYVDEVGESIKLIANASGNQINLSETTASGELLIDKIFINQIVFLQSDIETMSDQRIILNIEEVPISGNLVLELSGDGNLGKYKLSENANVRVFKPNTVNSGLYVLVPGDEQLDPDIETQVPFFLQTAGQDERRQKVDLRLGPDNDLPLTSNHDLALSFGLDNSVQAIKLKFEVEEGELQRHQDHGLISLQGSTNLDTQILREALMESIRGQIEADSRFDRIETLDAVYLVTNDDSFPGTAFVISMAVRLAGSSAVIPISFTVNIR